MTDLYTVLGVSATATHDELKKQYHSLARKHHPDKNINIGDNSFHRVEQAWKVLSDPTQRAQYDAKLRVAQGAPVHETVRLKETVHCVERKEYERACRCGGAFVLSEEDICEDLLVIGCDCCSLSILIDCTVANKENI